MLNRIKLLLKRLWVKFKIYCVLKLDNPSLGPAPSSNPLNPFSAPVPELESSYSDLKTRRGVKKLVRWLRALSPEQRLKLIRSKANIIPLSPPSDKSTLETLETYQAQLKSMKPIVSSEDDMANVAVSNARKYQLRLNLQKLHRKGKIEGYSATIIKEIESVRSELKSITSRSL